MKSIHVCPRTMIGPAPGKYLPCCSKPSRIYRKIPYLGTYLPCCCNERRQQVAGNHALGSGARRHQRKEPCARAQVQHMRLAVLGRLPRHRPRDRAIVCLSSLGLLSARSCLPGLAHALDKQSSPTCHSCAYATGASIYALYR